MAGSIEFHYGFARAANIVMRVPGPYSGSQASLLSSKEYRRLPILRAFRLCAVLMSAPLLLPCQDLKEFEKKVTEFTLANGLHFMVAERHEAPVVSFHTYVNAGSVDDPSGATGIAHMFEHMAFKGTESIGSKN